MALPKKKQIILPDSYILSEGTRVIEPSRFYTCVYQGNTYDKATLICGEGNVQLRCTQRGWLPTGAVCNEK